MRPVVKFSLKQNVLFNLVFVLLIVAGAFSVMELPVERYPQVNFGKVLISSFYPGASPSDVEALVTREIEESLEGLEDVEFIRANSSREFSVIVVKFRDDVDYDARYDELRFRVLSMLGDLPDMVEPPSFTMIQTADWLPVVSVNLVGERSNRALSMMAKELKIPLEQVDGVQEVVLEGEYQREFHVYLDIGRMNAQGISYEQVAAALEAANVSIPAGDFTDGSGEYVVKVDEKFRDREQVLDTVIRRDQDGSFVKLSDVASDAKISHRDPHVITSVNGRDGVTLKILKTEDGNALTIFDGIDRVVSGFIPVLQKQGVEVVLTQDSSTYIEESISTLGWNMALGIVLVSLIIWYFMGFRNAALTTVGIPFAFLVTMILMKLTGNSLNEITLFSFVLVSGIVVDDAIVVVENIYRHVQKGDDLSKAIIDGTSEVMIPVIAATATTVAAFLPMLLMTGSTGEFFALIPKAVSFAIIASLIECLLILPLHYRDYGPKPGHVPDEDHDNALMRPLRNITERIVNVTMRFRITSVSLVVVAFFVAISILVMSITGASSLIRIKFFPDDYNLYYAFIEGSADTSIEETAKKTKEMARFVMADGEGYARSAAGFGGFSVTEDYEQEFGHNRGTVMVALPKKDQRAFEGAQAHLERMRERLVERFAGNGFEIKVRAEKDGPPAGKDLNVRIVGDNEASVNGLAEDVLQALRGNEQFAEHLTQLEDDSGLPARVFRMVVDQARTQEHGLTTADAARLAASVLDGRFIGKFRAAEEEIDLKLRVDPTFLDSPEAALDVPLLQHPSGPVYLGDLVEPVAVVEPGELHRYQKQRSLTITANIKTGAPFSSPTVVAWVKDYYQGIRENYPGSTLVFGGEFEETQRSYTSLTYAFGLAVLLMYLILATQFHSYLQPMIVISAVVFSIIGVVFGKMLTQSLFTVNSFIAVVGVTGVVVNDALVLIDFINRGYRSGLSRQQAIREGIRVRLRPIVLTTLTTTLGLLPMAIGIPSYSLIWGAMASTFVTGLATATFLTLFIVPVEWDLLMGLKERMDRRKARRLEARAGEL
ncbi:acriflavin resistance protein [Solemya pervernicosa gill symbiont]|uniref:Acriflavin resistance protein n=2 Tax=Gammaproteobacteria incertae sedis TaxID=118884 RepID=A0A1T2KZV1_9GAMM|nr:efflux RND transporter permease subunit [Candidatus Reidiella endopervernicosa]OOZ38368.1 acriflavin resistance protein [Solemya pervernicosa gill symbiont]QKQ25907.1 efflux RND transporter permease subunit [Candidatus Reidiella endopervernicosa]